MTDTPASRFRVLLACILAAGLMLDGDAFVVRADDDGDDVEWADDGAEWGDDDDWSDSEWEDEWVAPAPAAAPDDDDGWVGWSAAAPVSVPLLQPQDDDDDDDDDCKIDDDDGNPLTDGFCNDQAMVRLVAGADVESVNNDFGTETIDEIAGRNTYLLALPVGSNEPAVVGQLEADDRVAWAELNFVDQAPEGRPQRFFLRGDTVPIPGTLNEAYAPELIGVPAAASCEQGAGVSIAIVDSGYDPSHPAFAQTTFRGAWNAFSNQDGAGNVDDIGNAEDDDGDGFIDEMTGHGSHVTGIVTQVAPGATIVPIKALDSDGIGQAFYLARAIYYAIDQNADVINMSLGSTADTRVVRDAAGDALGAGIFVAAAAGNNGGYEPREYPGTQPGVFGVAATNAGDQRAEFSSQHAQIDLSAPGEAIVSAYPLDQPPNSEPLGDYALWSGTSMATPWVAGAAALVIARNSTWSPEDVAARLQATASPISGDADGMGSGRLNVGAAIDCSSATVDEGEKDKKDKKKRKGKKGKKHKKRKHRR